MTTPPATATVCTPTCATDKVARTATVRWSLDGLEQTATDYNGTLKGYSYDSARRLKLLDYGDATPDVGYSWDKAGHRLSMTESGLTTATYQWDELGRLLTETRGSNVLRYGYDRRDQTTVTYPDNKKLTSTLDAAGRLQTLDDWRGSGSGRTSFAYDDTGRKVGRTLPSGAVTSWRWDRANRLEQVEHKASSTAAAFARFDYAYDRAGNRTRQSDYDSSRSPSGTDQYFEYDALHRLVRETPRAGIASVPNALGYDEAGNRKSASLGQALVEEDPGSSVSYGGTWSVDADNRATASEHRRAETNGSWVEFRFSGDAAALTYAALPDGDGGRLRATLDPGTSEERALGVVEQCSGSAAWQSVKTWSGLGDGAHVLRLTREEANCGSSTSARANVDAFRGYTRQKRYEHDADNRLEQVVEGATTTAFEYDKNGSTTKKTAGATTTTYTWDGARRLKEVKLNGSSQAAFGYDGNGARTSKTAGGQTTSYINDTRDLTRVLQEKKGSTTLSYAAGILQHDSSKGGAAQWAYFHADAQDNRALTDRNAAVTKRWEYDPFGSIRTQSGTATSDFQYADEQRDAETGLINLRARYYDPVLARFISRDALKGHDGFPQSFNRYSYAYNNPVRFIDPSGYDGEDGWSYDGGSGGDEVATENDPGGDENPSGDGGGDSFTDGGPDVAPETGADAASEPATPSTDVEQTEQAEVDNETVTVMTEEEPPGEPPADPANDHIADTPPAQPDQTAPVADAITERATDQVPLEGESPVVEAQDTSGLTFGVGVGGSVTGGGGYVGGSAHVTVASNGDIGVVSTVSGGGSSGYSVSGGPSVQVSDAPSISALEGQSATMGGSVNGLGSVDYSKNDQVQSVTVSGDVFRGDAITPVEVHGGGSYTWTASINPMTNISQPAPNDPSGTDKPSPWGPGN